MPGQTPKLGLPYPLPTDPIADGANQIKAIAEVVDTGLLKLAVVKISARTDNNTSSNHHTLTATAPMPVGFTKLIGGFVSYTKVIGDPLYFSSYITINTLEIENDGTQIKVSGESCVLDAPVDVNVLVWGY